MIAVRRTLRVSILQMVDIERTDSSPRVPRAPNDAWILQDDPFPLQKPECYILGPITRTRNQRGWYKIVQFPRASGVALCSAARRPATAADIPQELLGVCSRNLVRRQARACRLASVILQFVLNFSFFLSLPLFQSSRILC